MKKVPKHIFCLNQSIHQSIINKLFEKCTTLEMECDTFCNVACF